jgi:hypothetical protein
MPSSSYLADGQDKEGGDYGIGASSQQMLAVAKAIYIFGEVRGGWMMWHISRVKYKEVSYVLLFYPIYVSNISFSSVASEI